MHSNNNTAVLKENAKSNLSGDCLNGFLPFTVVATVAAAAVVAGLGVGGVRLGRAARPVHGRDLFRDKSSGRRDACTGSGSGRIELGFWGTVEQKLSHLN